MSDCQECGLSTLKAAQKWNLSKMLDARRVNQPFQGSLSEIRLTQHGYLSVEEERAVKEVRLWLADMKMPNDIKRLKEFCMGYQKKSDESMQLFREQEEKKNEKTQRCVKKTKELKELLRTRKKPNKKQLRLLNERPNVSRRKRKRLRRSIYHH
jgi:hypothetical protein